MSDKVVFHLARDFNSPSLRGFEPPEGLEHLTIYALFKNGFKKSEIRHITDGKGFGSYWFKRLFRPLTGREISQLPLGLASCQRTAVDMTDFLKVYRAWLVEGYPKGSLLPRLEADIKAVLFFPVFDDCRLEIEMENFVEVTKTEVS